MILSCSQNKTNSPKITPPFIASPLDSIYKTIRPAIQSFTIDNRKVNKIKANRGTEILIPANSFITSNGKSVENVQLEIVEAFSLPDFLASGLVTLSNGKLLMSNGMMYINAKANNENVQLKDGNSLSVSMPTMTNNTGFQLFQGDGQNWTIDSSMTTNDYSIPLPLDLLYPEGNKVFWTCIINVGDKDEKYYFLDTNIVTVTKQKYENTIIATQEFKSRIYVLREMMENMSYFTNSDYYFDKVNCENEKFNYTIYKIYFDHPEKSFIELDSIAKKIYRDYFQLNKDKIYQFCEQVNQHKRSYFSNWSDTNYYFDFRKQSLEDYFMSPLKYFPKDNKNILVLDDRGINLDAQNAFEQLLAKGLAISEINQLLTYHFKQSAIISQLQREKDAIVNKNKLDEMYQSTVFSVAKMGWINCDRFYDDPMAAQANIYVRNISKGRLDFVDYSLVIPDLNIRLSAYQSSSGNWSFTKKNGPYTKLPIGKDAVITGISLQNDSVFFAYKKIKIQDNLSVDLPMKYIIKNSLRDSLAFALKH